MKAYIVHDSPLGTDYSGAGMYALITEKEETLYKTWCSNRDFANSDLSRGLKSLLDEKGVTEVWSRGILVWKGKITNEAYAAFREANDWYELNNSDAR